MFENWGGATDLGDGEGVLLLGRVSVHHYMP